MLYGVEHDRTVVMLDPVTDQVLAECSGPAADGKCPQTARPPYICEGLHLVDAEGGPARDLSLTVTMDPGRCPLAALGEPSVI